MCLRINLHSFAVAHSRERQLWDEEGKGERERERAQKALDRCRLFLGDWSVIHRKCDKRRKEVCKLNGFYGARQWERSAPQRGRRRETMQSFANRATNLLGPSGWKRKRHFIQAKIAQTKTALTF